MSTGRLTTLPASDTVEEIRPIRDDLEQRVRGLLGELEIEPAW